MDGVASGSGVDRHRLPGNTSHAPPLIAIFVIAILVIIRFLIQNQNTNNEEVINGHICNC